MEQAHDPKLHENTPPDTHYYSTVDTSQPFRSVKEAVAILGNHLLTRPTCSANPSNKVAHIFSSSPKHSSPSPRNSRDGHDDDVALADTVKKLETELDQMRAELRRFKERGLETETALTSLTAELHQSMARLARVEAWPGEGVNKKKDLAIEKGRSGSRPSLGKVLSVREVEEEEGSSRVIERKRRMKTKPIIPFFGDLMFCKKKGLNKSVNDPLHALSPLNWN